MTTGRINQGSIVCKTFFTRAHNSVSLTSPLIKLERAATQVAQIPNTEIATGPESFDAARKHTAEQGPQRQRNSLKAISRTSGDVSPVLFDSHRSFGRGHAGHDAISPFSFALKCGSLREPLYLVSLVTLTDPCSEMECCALSTLADLSRGFSCQYTNLSHSPRNAACTGRQPKNTRLPIYSSSAAAAAKKKSHTHTLTRQHHNEPALETDILILVAICSRFSHEIPVASQ